METYQKVSSVRRLKSPVLCEKRRKPNNYTSYLCFKIRNELMEEPKEQKVGHSCLSFYYP